MATETENKVDWTKLKPIRKSGLDADYIADNFVNTLYLATDTKKLYYNGVVYGQGEIADGSIDEAKLDSALKTKINDVYTKSEIDTELGKKADADDVYTKDDIDSTLEDYAKSANVYTKLEVDNKLDEVNTSIDGVYTKKEVDDALDLLKSNILGDGIKDSYDTLVEFQTWLEGHETAANKMSEDIGALKTGKADADKVYTKTEVNTELDKKADTTDVEALQSALDTANETIETLNTTIAELLERIENLETVVAP